MFKLFNGSIKIDTMSLLLLFYNIINILKLFEQRHVLKQETSTIYYITNLAFDREVRDDVIKTCN